MPDWNSTMERSYEYYIVDPGTWKDVRLVTTVTSCKISRDWESETLGSISIDLDETIGEEYIRVYLVTIQNGIRERFPLGTYLVQSPGSSYDGKRTTRSLDAYTPLIELKENNVPIGYYVEKDTNIMDVATRLTKQHLRAPVVGAVSDIKVYKDFVANVDDTWLSFLTDLIANAKFYYGLDELGRILFEPKQDTASLQPRYTFDDSNSSILTPEIEVNRDLYGIPNVVEVVYSDENDYYVSRVVNDNENSPISTVKRGREIVYRDTNPSLQGIPTQDMIDEYAQQLLESLSTLEYTVKYKHAYNEIRIGDCVRLNYERAGMKNVKARVTAQNITCDSKCTVEETAIFTEKLWR